MINSILTATGIQFRQGRFLSPPADTYAVYFDDIDTDGPDWVAPVSEAGLPMIYTHNVRIELYEPTQDIVAEAATEAALRAQGLTWTKEDRIWLQDVQRYQVIYEFSYTTK